MVGSSVAVPAAAVTVRVAGSIVDVGGSVPVGVQGIGWKGVIVAVAFGAAVTKTKGSEDCTGAGASDPHPASSIPARNMSCTILFIRYCDGLGGVFDGVNVGATVAVNVEVGTVVSVGMIVFVAVGKLGMIVTPGTGVMVGTFGTQSNCPA